MSCVQRPTAPPASAKKYPVFSFVATVIKQWPTSASLTLKESDRLGYEEKATIACRYNENEAISGSPPLKLSLLPSPSPSPPPSVTIAVAVADKPKRRRPRVRGRAGPHHWLLQVPSPSVNGSEATPVGPLSPPSVTNMNLTTTAHPTTLTLHAPDFDMHRPPLNRSSHSRSPPPTILPSSPSRHPTQSTASSSSSKGQIHVKLISARGLNVSSLDSRPYVVVVFENNEFVSRDPTNEGDKEVRGIATNLSRTSSSIAISALGAVGYKAVAQEAALRTRRQSPVSSSSSNSAKSSLSIPGVSGSRTPSNGLLGRMSAHNPVWKHEVSL
jgi:hypothetical protein